MCLALALPAAAAAPPDTGVPQPVAFSHAVHAGENKIACLYCHHRADRATVAGIPPVRVCIDCHDALSKEPDGFQPVRDAWANHEPIAWTKVTDLPDHVRFTHKRHVQAGVSCTTCHGEVEEMQVVRLPRPWTMGRCVECHRAAAVELPVHGKPVFVREADNPHRDTFDAPVVERDGVRIVRPTLDCAGCHH